jgi:large subunit ribosomal protein L25
VNLDERVEVAVTVHLRGTPVGTEEGGVLTQTVDQIQVACAVRAIPEEITHLVTEMKLNDTLTAGELKLPEGVELLEDPETVVASVTFVAEEPEEEEGEGEEAPTEPELIGRETEEEEGEGAEE